MEDDDDDDDDIMNILRLIVEIKTEQTWYFVDSTHEMYQYSLRIALWGLKHVGVFHYE